MAGTGHLVDDILLGEAADAFVLAASGLDAVDEFRVAGRRMAEVLAFVRSVGGEGRDYGNAHAEVSFTATREHASPIAARQYILERAKALGVFALPTDGQQRTLHLTYKAGGLLAYSMPKAALDLYDGVAIGATTIHHVRLVGGPIT
jgi:hypothetical protein